tara:strand:- start:85 stop:189 length:105 start_codon:yes stop_codon:yes gene_type:complete
MKEIDQFKLNLLNQLLLEYKQQEGLKLMILELKD